MRWVWALAFVAGVVLSIPLWQSDRFLPTVPVFDFFGFQNFYFDLIQISLLILLPILIAFNLKTKILIQALVIVSTAAVLGDWNRLQPWFYHYFLMLAALSSLSSCRLIICAFYFWSGIQKVNFSFLHDLVPWLLSPFVEIKPGPISVCLGLAAIIFEISIAFFLLSSRLRKYGVWMAVGMHLFLLLALGPFGKNWNWIVWPWNLAMIAFVLVLFARESKTNWKEILIPRSLVHGMITVLVLVMPVFSFFGIWDSYLSFRLYSNNTKIAKIELDQRDLAVLPENLRARAVEKGSVSLFWWSTVEAAVSPYPEDRYFRGVFQTLCSKLSPATTTKLVIRDVPDWRTGEAESQSYSCR